jgi:hypothetical protein
VNSASRQGEQVVLEIEPSKGGDKEQMTVDVVLVSAGGFVCVGGLLSL